MKKFEEPEGELPRKPVPRGLEKNEAFREYMSMSRGSREALKMSAPEAPDISRLANKDEQLEALQAVVKSHVDLIRDQQRVIGNFKAAFHHITQTILKVTEDEILLPVALREITGVILELSGVDPNESKNDPETH
jgi:hypothetical protein